MPPVDLTASLALRSKPGEKESILFDRAVPGFGLRIHPSGRKVYIIQTRIEGQIRRMVIGKHGEMDFRTARRRARDLLARIRAGENPAEEARVAARMPTFKVFAQEYVLRCDSCWRPSGRKTVRIYLKARILPAFGRMRLDEIEPEDVGEWFAAASQDKPGAANRELEILRAMMSRAEEWGWLERDSNLCLNIRKNARHQIPRFLDRQELERLGRTLDLHERRGGSLGREQDRTTTPIWVARRVAQLSGRRSFPNRRGGVVVWGWSQRSRKGRFCYSGVRRRCRNGRVFERRPPERTRGVNHGQRTDTTSRLRNRKERRVA